MSSLLGCKNSNPELNQTAAEITAKQFISQNVIHSDVRNWGESGTFGEEGITNISPLSQFTESEASLVISFDYKVSPEFEFLKLKFNYKKDVNENWMLNSVEEVQGVYSETGIYSKRLQTILDNAKELTILVANTNSAKPNNQNLDNLAKKEQELKLKQQELEKREQELITKEKAGNYNSTDGVGVAEETSAKPKNEVVNKSFVGEWVNEKGQKLNIIKLNDKAYTVKGCPKAEQSVFDIKPEVTYNAVLGEDGILYVEQFCDLTLNGDKLSLKSQSYKNSDITYTKNSGFNAQTSNKEVLLEKLPFKAVDMQYICEAGDSYNVKKDKLSIYFQPNDQSKTIYYFTQGEQIIFEPNSKIINGFKYALICNSKTIGCKEHCQGWVKVSDLI